MSRRTTNIGALLLFVVLSVLMTWPQARLIATHLPDSHDPLLSIWRIAWIAHILPTAPADLMNGNIFYPEPRTLAYTDSVLLQGLAAAPLIWAGLTPMVTYTLLILASIALSGWTMFLYARHLTNRVSAALLAGIVFAFVPFRFDHLQHLELQATMFLPLALLWVDRALETGSRRNVWLAVAAVVGGLVVLPYLAVYVLNRSSLGDRTSSDVLAYSATLWNYLSTPNHNVVHGGWSGALGQNERRLFPGIVALAIAAAGVVGVERRRLTLAVVGLVGFVISLGLNTPVYSILSSVLFIYNGLRAPARASILVFLALAGLVAFGWARLERSLKGWAPAATAVAALALLGEYATVQSQWFVATRRPPQVYEWLARQPRSVVLELPLTTADRLDLVPDGIYMFRSTEHWHPILNGYSGFFPGTFLELTERMKTFPDEASIAYLKQRQVDLIVVHGGLLAPDRFGAITTSLLGRPDVEANGQFEEPMGPDMVFRLIR